MAAAIVISGISVFVTPAANAVSDTTKTKKFKQVKVQYTCPMHHDVLSGKPGKCPKCGMTLVKKEPAKKKA